MKTLVLFLLFLLIGCSSGNVPTEVETHDDCVHISNKYEGFSFCTTPEGYLKFCDSSGDCITYRGNNELCRPPEQLEVHERATSR